MQCLHILFKVTDSFQHPPWYDYITTSSYRIFEIVLLSITRSNRIDQNNNEKDKKKHILHCVSLSRHRVSLDVSTRIWFFITVTICGFFSFSLPSTSIEVWCILTLVIFMNTKDHWARKKAGTNEQNKKINKQTQFYIYSRLTGRNFNYELSQDLFNSWSWHWYRVLMWCWWRRTRAALALNWCRSARDCRCFSRNHLDDIRLFVRNISPWIYLLNARSFSRWFFVNHVAGSPKVFVSSDARTCLNCSTKIISARLPFNHLKSTNETCLYPPLSFSLHSLNSYFRTASSFSLWFRWSHVVGSPSVSYSCAAFNCRNCSNKNASLFLRSNHCLCRIFRNSSDSFSFAFSRSYWRNNTSDQNDCHSIVLLLLFVSNVSLHWCVSIRYSYPATIFRNLLSRERFVSGVFLLPVWKRKVFFRVCENRRITCFCCSCSAFSFARFSMAAFRRSAWKSTPDEGLKEFTAIRSNTFFGLPFKMSFERFRKICTRTKQLELCEKKSCRHIRRTLPVVDHWVLRLVVFSRSTISVEQWMVHVRIVVEVWVRSVELEWTKIYSSFRKNRFH